MARSDAERQEMEAQISQANRYKEALMQALAHRGDLIVTWPDASEDDILAVAAIVEDGLIELLEAEMAEMIETVTLFREALSE
jgi:hypothetical protein